MKEKIQRRIEVFCKGLLSWRLFPFRIPFLAGGLALACLLSFLTKTYTFAQTKETIVDEWATVQAPKPPELKPVTVDPKVTALLVLDIVKIGRAHV